jgi:hypothetical protein
MHIECCLLTSVDRQVYIRRMPVGKIMLWQQAPANGVRPTAA